MVVAAVGAAMCLVTATDAPAKDKKGSKKAKTSQVAAAEKDAHQHDHGSAKQGDGGGADMTEFWALMSPGEGHKLLEPFIGQWDVVTRMRMAPDQEWMESVGTSDISWAFGGRYLVERVKAVTMGLPFEGLGYTGYDNFRKEYVGLWLDNMSTAPMTSRGSVDETGKKFTYKSKADDVMTGRKDVEIRVVLTVVDKGHITMEMHSPDVSGKPFLSMTIKYKRRPTNEG